MSTAAEVVILFFTNQCCISELFTKIIVHGKVNLSFKPYHQKNNL